MSNLLRETKRETKLVIPPGPNIRLCHVGPLTHDDAGAWNEYVLAHNAGTIFHTTGWKQAVERTFPHRPQYLVARRGRRIAGVLPMFLVNSRLAGRLLVSVPYGVGGGILADDNRVACALFERAKRIAEIERCRTIDLRSSRAVIDKLSIVDRYVGFERVLPDRAEDVLGWLPRKARAAARNGRDKYKLSVSFGREHLRDVWLLYAQSMRRLASLAYPEKFFVQLAASFNDKTWVHLVRKDGRPVAGLIRFLYRDRVLPYFIGTTEQARRCSAANFIYLCVMERAVREGYRIFDFGRSRVDNRGSFDFKRFHGFTPTPLQYQVYTPPGEKAPDLSPTNAKFAFARRVWPYLPLRVTRSVGAYVARHVPG